MDGILYFIEEAFQGLSMQNQKIATYLLKNSKEIIWLSSKQFAQKIDVSQATITRFCQKFGYEGFGQLKIVLSQDIAKYHSTNFSNIESEEFKNNISQNLLNQNLAALIDTQSMIDSTALMKAAKLIHGAQNIICSGIGASNLVAQDMCQKLLRIQKKVSIYSENDLRKIALSQYTKDDLLIAVSYSGKKHETIELAKIAKAQNVPIIGFTRVGKTPLASLCDVSLQAAAFEYEYRTSALTSRIVHLYLIDVLFYTYGLFFQKDANQKMLQTYKIINPDDIL